MSETLTCCEDARAAYEAARDDSVPWVEKDDAGYVIFGNRHSGVLSAFPIRYCPWCGTPVPGSVTVDNQLTHALRDALRKAVRPR